MVTVFNGRNWKGCIREETDLLDASVVCLPYDSESIAPLYRPSASFSLFVQSSLRLVATLSFVIIVSSDVLLVYQLSIFLAPFLHRFAIRKNVGIVSPFTNLQLLASDTSSFSGSPSRNFVHSSPSDTHLATVIACLRAIKTNQYHPPLPFLPPPPISLYVCMYLSIYLSISLPTLLPADTYFTPFCGRRDYFSLPNCPSTTRTYPFISLRFRKLSTLLDVPLRFLLSPLLDHSILFAFLKATPFLRQYPLYCRPCYYFISLCVIGTRSLSFLLSLLLCLFLPASRSRNSPCSFILFFLFLSLLRLLLALLLLLFASANPSKFFLLSLVRAH